MNSTANGSKQDLADVFSPEHPCQQIGPMIERGRFPTGQIEKAPTKRHTYRIGSLRFRINLMADEGRLDLWEQLTTEQAIKLAEELDSDPEAVRSAIHVVRRGRGVNSLAGHSNKGPRKWRSARELAGEARLLALETVRALLATGQPECLLRAATLTEQIMQEDRKAPK